MKTFIKIYHLLGYGIFVGLVFFDIITINKPILGLLATILWLSSFCYLFFYSLTSLVELIHHSINKRLCFSVLILFFWLLMGFFNAGNPKNQSGETTQEVNCVLNYLQQSGNYGYQENCFFGYPARTYFLSSLPSLVFGRTLLSLNLGGLLFFIFGLIIFTRGIIKFNHYSHSGDLIGAIILSSFAHFYYVNHFVFSYEQSYFPMAIGMIMIGLFLSYIQDKKSVPLYLIGFTLLYLIYSYTTALSLYFFFVLVLVYFILKKIAPRNDRLIFLCLIFLTLISFYFSLGIRKDINLWSVSERNWSLLRMDLEKTFEHLILQNNGIAFVSPFFNFIFFGFLILSLFFLFGWQLFLIACWVISVIVFAEISKGYSYYGIDFRLHRIMVVIPVVLTALALSIGQPDFKDKKKLVLGLLVVLFLSGVFYQQRYLSSKKINKHYFFIQWLINNGFINKKEKQALYFTGDTNRNYISLNDSVQYFLPNLQVEQLIEELCILPEDQKGIYVVSAESDCYSQINKEDLSQVKSYLFGDDNFYVFRND